MLIGTKIVGMLGTIGTGTMMLAQGATEVPFIQYGAIGILGVCIVYTTTRLVPMAIKSRQAETEAFVRTLTDERQKLVVSMDNLVSNHSKEVIQARLETNTLIRELNDDYKEERKIWAGLMVKNNEALEEMCITLRGIANTPPCENFKSKA